MNKAKIKFRGSSQFEEVMANANDNSLDFKGKKCSVNDLSFDVPVAGTVYGTLLNFKGAMEKMGDALTQAPYKEAPKAPIMYIKPVNTFTGNGTAIPLPTDVKELEAGASLGIVIGKDATRVSEQEALNYVAGYTIVNDVSIPHESIHRPAINQKCRDGFCPIGPWVIEKEAVTNPDNLSIKVLVNGEVKQENTTANLIRSVSRLIADITDFMTLQAGDTLLIGVPENAPRVKSGDVVRIEIEGVGRLENTVVPENELVGGKSL